MIYQYKYSMPNLYRNLRINLVMALNFDLFKFLLFNLRQELQSRRRFGGIYLKIEAWIMNSLRSNKPGHRQPVSITVKWLYLGLLSVRWLLINFQPQGVQNRRQPVRWTVMLSAIQSWSQNRFKLKIIERDQFDI